MATITLPPILLQNSSQDASAPFSGPFEVSGARYIVTVEFSPVNAIHVWKSTDSGATWTIQDSANEPTAKAAYDVVLIGTVFSIVSVPGISPSLSLTTFDTATDTYGATVASGYTSSGVGALITALSDGTIYMFYQKGDTSLKYTTFAVGAFGPEVAFAVAGSQSFRAVSVDGSDVIYAYWKKFTSGPSTFTLNVSTITAGVLSAPQAVHADSTGQFVNFSRQNSAVWGTKLAFASGDSNARAGVWIGDPIGAPVWAFTLIDDIDWAGMGLAGEVDDEPFVYVKDGTLYVFWIALDYDPVLAADVIDRIYYKSNDGSGWSAPVLFYDAVSNPELDNPTDPFNQFIHVTNFAILSDGTFGAVINLEEGVFCATYYLRQAPCDITITITPHASPPEIVPNDGGIFALPPAFGFTPYTFTSPSSPTAPIAMQAVDGAGPPQNFAYSISEGDLPTGMVLGSAITGSGSTPEDSSAGLDLTGTPSTNPTDPVTYIVKGHVRLIG